MSDSDSSNVPEDLQTHDDLQLWETRQRVQRSAKQDSHELTMKKRWDNLKLGAVVVGILAVGGMLVGLSASLLNAPILLSRRGLPHSLVAFHRRDR